MDDNKWCPGGGGGNWEYVNMSRGGEFEGRIYVSWGVLGCMCIIVCPENREKVT